MLAAKSLLLRGIVKTVMNMRPISFTARRLAGLPLMSALPRLWTPKPIRAGLKA